MKFLAICLLLLPVVVSHYLRIGAFNIQIFGQTKMKKAHVMQRLTEIVSKYDIMLVQEVRDSQGLVMPHFLSLLNANCPGAYHLVNSTRLGRSSSKEQYAFYYRPDKVSLVGTHQYEDKGDKFEREPFAASFRVDSVDGVYNGKRIEFSMIALHSKPTDAVAELEELDEVYADVATKLKTPNAILLGDFNADCRYASATKRRTITIFNSQSYTSLIGDEIDTNTNNNPSSSSSDCAYDRIVVTGSRDFRKAFYDSGVDHFDQDLSLSNDEAKEVSDHYPVESKLNLTALEGKGATSNDQVIFG